MLDSEVRSATRHFCLDDILPVISATLALIASNANGLSHEIVERS